MTVLGVRRPRAACFGFVGRTAVGRRKSSWKPLALWYHGRLPFLGLALGQDTEQMKALSASVQEQRALDDGMGTKMLQIKRYNMFLTLAALVGVVALAAACGSSDGGSGDNQGMGGDGGSAGDGNAGENGCPDCANPPGPSADGVPGVAGATTVLAINKLDFGLNSGWKSIGYDLDGQKSNINTENHCKLAEGAPNSTKADGTNGIDNSFGANIVPVIADLFLGFSDEANQAFNDGSFALLLEVQGLGEGSDYVSLPASMFAGAGLGQAPSWDGTDVWPVYCELMNDCKETGTAQFPTASSKIRFPNSYVTGNTWVSGDKRTISLSLSIQGITVSLDINQAVLTANLVGSPANAANKGVIAGVIEAQKLVDSLFEIAGNISPELCDTNSTLASTLRGLVMRATDIMKDGTQDPSKDCDGISVGIAFEMKAAQLGAVLDKNPPSAGPCQ